MKHGGKNAVPELLMFICGVIYVKGNLFVSIRPFSCILLTNDYTHERQARKMERAMEWKIAITAALGALTALWGWFGWLVVLWIVCMLVDYIMGTAAACKCGTWSSGAARHGILGKLGSIAVVLASGMLDFMIMILTQHLPIPGLPFPYTVFLCPIVIAWYILTELGSILENAGELGANLPEFLTKRVAALKKKL